MALLEVDRLSVYFNSPEEQIRVVNALSYSVNEGEILGIVGESGSGKTQSVLSILGLLAKNASAEGSIKFKNREILNVNQATLNCIRGTKIAVIFQDPMTSLNPYLRVRTQMAEVLTHHQGITFDSALKQAISALEMVKIADAKKRIQCYPHELSGGMRQRVMIAMAILCRPNLIIADEPTTALDVTIQAQILRLLSDLRKETGIALILITHDLGVIAELCDTVLVMYAGRLMEYGAVSEIYQSPCHPYTKALLQSIPRTDRLTKDGTLHEIPGNPPNFAELPNGCPFSDRCEYRFDPCRNQPLMERTINNRRRIACHRTFQ